jgi:hypothetical protein
MGETQFIQFNIPKFSIPHISSKVLFLDQILPSFDPPGPSEDPPPDETFVATGKAIEPWAGNFMPLVNT